MRRGCREEFPDIAIMVLSAHVDVEHAMEFWPAGTASVFA